MSSSTPGITAARTDRGRIHLILTAERLFAEHGIDNVSLRQIATEAGYANPVTIQYHFGTKAALLEAIVDYRLPGIDRRRIELLNNLGDIDICDLAEVMARPFLELDAGCRYPDFVSQLVVTVDAWAAVNDAVVSREGDRRLHAAYDRLVPDVGRAERLVRMQFATLLMLHSLAARRRLTASGHPPELSDRNFQRVLLRSIAAVLIPPEFPDRG